LKTKVGQVNFWAMREADGCKPTAKKDRAATLNEAFRATSRGIA
jgi:hypothetical protein